tara:strand:- start:80 stop:994 length:915 start_codon:yes stop_codon:yes gene_type:complete
MWKHKSGYWYASVKFKGKKKVFSLKTKNERDALKNLNNWKDDKLEELINQFKLHKRKNWPLHKYYKLFLADKKPEWSKKTYSNYECFIRRYCTTFNYTLPDTLNPQSRYTYRNHINSAYKWGYENNYSKKLIRLTDGNRIYRNRCFSDHELSIILNNHSDPDYNDFLNFAYFTGARRGEINSLSKHQMDTKYIRAGGKSKRRGGRIIKLNKQAREILKKRNNVLWKYREDYITNTFIKYMNRLEIQDARFHDIRRTFGLNHIRKGVPIYEVSKMLGHKDLSTTEKIYAPLLVSEIPDYDMITGH